MTMPANSAILTPVHNLRQVVIRVYIQAIGDIADHVAAARLADKVQEWGWWVHGGGGHCARPLCRCRHEGTPAKSIMKPLGAICCNLSHARPPMIFASFSSDVLQVIMTDMFWL